MPGTPPSRPWLSKDWREYLLELAEDIKALQAYVPTFDQSLRDVMGGGGGGGPGSSRTFPAVITRFSNFDNKGCNYTAKELLKPRGIDAGGDGSTIGELLTASNVYEEGFECGSPGNLSIPPSVYGDQKKCFGDFDCQGFPISSGNADINTIVIMHAQVCQDPNANSNDPEAPLAATCFITLRQLCNRALPVLMTMTTLGCCRKQIR